MTNEERTAERLTWLETARRDLVATVSEIALFNAPGRWERVHTAPRPSEGYRTILEAQVRRLQRDIASCEAWLEAVGVSVEHPYATWVRESRSGHARTL